MAHVFASSWLSTSSRGFECPILQSLRSGAALKLEVNHTSRMKTCTHDFFKCAGHLLLSSAIICIGVASVLVSTSAAVQAMVRISVSFSA